MLRIVYPIDVCSSVCSKHNNKRDKHYLRVLYNTITTVVGLVTLLTCGKWLCVTKDFKAVVPKSGICTLCPLAVLSIPWISVYL